MSGEPGATTDRRIEDLNDLVARLASGDACVLAGPARLARHGVDRILPGSSTLVPGGGRLNLTLRRARPGQIVAPRTRPRRPQAL